MTIFSERLIEAAAKTGKWPEPSVDKALREDLQYAESLSIIDTAERITLQLLRPDIVWRKYKDERLVQMIICEVGVTSDTGRRLGQIADKKTANYAKLVTCMKETYPTAKIIFITAIFGALGAIGDRVHDLRGVLGITRKFWEKMLGYIVSDIIKGSALASQSRAKQEKRIPAYANRAYIRGVVPLRPPLKNYLTPPAVQAERLDTAMVHADVIYGEDEEPLPESGFQTWAAGHGFSWA